MLVNNNGLQPPYLNYYFILLDVLLNELLPKKWGHFEKSFITFWNLVCHKDFNISPCTQPCAAQFEQFGMSNRFWRDRVKCFLILSRIVCNVSKPSDWQQLIPESKFLTIVENLGKSWHFLASLNWCTSRSSATCPAAPLQGPVT